MNKKLLLTLGFMTLALTAIHAQDDDDLYFTPSKKQSRNMSATVENVTATQMGTSSRPTLEVYNNNSRSDDEYNRRFSNYAGSWQTGGSSETDSLMAAIDSLEAEIEMLKQGEYDVYDPEMDFVYSRRLLRFHSPRIGLVISSPYYWDLVYGYGIYDYLYDPYYDYLYDPFFWNYGWGYGWNWGPWSAWYGPIYGWYAPNHWDYWGVGPMWHTGGYGNIHIHSVTYRGNSWNRGTFTQNRFGATGNLRTSALATSGTRSGNTLAATTARTNATQSLATRTRATSANTAVGRTSSTRTAGTTTRATGTTTRATGTTARTAATTTRTSAAQQGVTRSSAAATTTNRTAATNTTTTNRTAATNNTTTRTTTSNTATTRSSATTTTTTRSASSSAGSYSSSSGISSSIGSMSSGSMSSGGMSSGGGVSRSAGSSGRR